jgi:hypothetical protein
MSRVRAANGGATRSSYARLYVEQFSRDGDQRPPYDDRRADVPL